MTEPSKRRVLRALFVLLAFPLILWGTLALHFAGPRSGATVLPVAWAVLTIGILLFVRPFGRRARAFALAAATLMVWWSTIRPSNDRRWQPDVARPPYTQLHGDELTIHNVRNFDYRCLSSGDPRTCMLPRAIGRSSPGTRLRWRRRTA